MTRSHTTSIKNRVAADAIISLIGAAPGAYTAAGTGLRNVAEGAARMAGKTIPGPVGKAVELIGPAAVGYGAYWANRALHDNSQEREQLRLDQIAATERAHRNAVNLAYHQENARTPGRQAEGQAKVLEAMGYLEKSRAEAAKTRSEVGEAQAQDILNFGRSIYGTGLRA